MRSVQVKGPEEKFARRVTQVNRVTARKNRLIIEVNREIIKIKMRIDLQRNGKQ
jgi:hypothetical protein